MPAADGEERHLPPACCGPSPEVLRDALCNRFAAGDCLRPQSARGYAGGVHFSTAVIADCLGSLQSHETSERQLDLKPGGVSAPFSYNLNYFIKLDRQW